MKSVTVRAPAKINLSLGVGPARSDGYHPLATVYMAVDLYDEVRAQAVDGDEISVTVHVDADARVEIADVPQDESNLAVRAALLLREATEIDDGAALTIRKVIPVAGGMAGGSADAAAALVACNELWGTALSKSELDALATRLGSDVPFSLHGGLALGSGRGELVSPVLARGSYHWVFAIADYGLSTADVYAEFDRLNEGLDVLP
ncbi:MAG: 4-(cytidine 5-diphospho)-2-C-methyl-D-erythritol kinase, partial [Nocardioidaceae bacterium]|nr:4-(cytidine 5-diphospho)-2-C-methyl-D-erythritol kinase [Nocardioidaceae bacterium]